MRLPHHLLCIGLGLARKPLGNASACSNAERPTLVTALLPALAVSLSALLLLAGTDTSAQETGVPDSAEIQTESEWRADLAPAANGDSYGPLEELVLRIPEDVPFEVLLRLGVEVDAIDVTPLLAFEDQAFTYRPQQALEPGEHQVRLVELTPDGEIVTRGDWIIEVSGEAALADASLEQKAFSLSATNSVEFSQRLDDKGFSNQPSRGQVSGGGYADTAFSSGPWSVTGNANYLLETQKERTANGRRFDLGEYNLNTRFDGEDFFGQVALGHQNLDVDNYIMSNYSRRGLSASLGSADEFVTVTGFSFLPESTVGSENLTGLNDSDNKLLGFQATAHPIPAWGKAPKPASASAATTP